MLDDQDSTQSPERLAALYRYQILDTPREPAFDQLVELAASICEAPISVINLIEGHRQWFKAEVGLGIRETPLDISICRHVLLQPGITVIEDMRDDQRLCFNPLVNKDSGLRFYAGCLLEDPNGQGIGTLCVLDRRPRELSGSQRKALKTLADQVLAQMELRLAISQKNELLAQKDLLLQEVNHRTKNNLQLISSLIQLQARRLTNPIAKKALMDTQARISSIALMHEKLYQASDTESVDLSVFLDSLIDGLRDTVSAKVRFEVDTVPVYVSLDKAIPLSLIVNELITNALKYAYPGAGTVWLSLAERDQRFELRVWDEGVGLPQGFDIHTSRSLGMKLITSLAKQIGSEAELKALSPGVECRLRFTR